MASEDVIELGSSDDEAGPVPKKMKPTPNAMVHIPTKFHDVTIKPMKSNLSGIPRVLPGKNVTMTKISKNSNNLLTNPYACKTKFNGKQVSIKPVIAKQFQQKPIPQKLVPTFTQISKNPIIINTSSVNPLSIMKKINSQVVINKVSTAPKMLKNPIKVNSPQTINNLPPNITITKTGPQKRVAPISISSAVLKKQKTAIPKTMVGEVLTVDLDDDELSSASTASPQWYLRPEEQTNPIEEKNNEEPKPSREMIEITIEDSPVKPPLDKRTCAIGTELAVTIEDSPIKNTVQKSPACSSDGEAKSENKTPHSKKKLEYPKEAEVPSAKTVEIEIFPIEENEPLETETVSKPQEKTNTDNIIEIEESPLKVQGLGTSTPKKERPVPMSIPDTIQQLRDVEETDELVEFHPVYRNFIRLCFQLENSEDMKKIVEKKIKTYYRQVPKEYTESEEFIEMVSGKVLSMKAGPEKMYLYIKDIVDELNLQRKMAKSQVLSSIKEKKNTDGEKYYYGGDSEFDSKRQRQIRKLEKTLKKLHRAIQKLEDQEVDFDDEEDSVYLLTESDEGSTSNKDSDRQLEKDPKILLQRYKERMVRVHAKFCQLTNTKMPSEPRVQIDARPGQASGPAKRLEKWINKKVPIGTPLPFPDFHDVLRCVREANNEDKLGWNEADIMEEARDLFTRCGKKLQRRRQENEWRIAASRISADIDPAENNQDLLRKLEDNKTVAAKRETEVFNKYADRQSQLKLEAEEIGDKEAEESPADDDEDEELERSDEKSLENKEKRKERLKRLLHEKSKKMVENQKNNEDKVENDEGKPGDIENRQENKTDDRNIVKSKTSQKEDIKETKRNNDKVDSEAKEINEEKIDKDISENESIKTVDSDKVEIVPNDEKNKASKKSKLRANKVTVEKNIPADTEKAHSISDESSNMLVSDVDELNLLQKLHSGNEMNTSTLESSDSETPIAISDTLGSSSDNKKQRSSDVISIENSSYSESEIDTKENKRNSSDLKADNKKINDMEVGEGNVELKCSNTGIKKKATTNNDEYNESIEDILLASTDDETDKTLEPMNVNECVNINDDSMSIGDTIVQGIDKEQAIESDKCNTEKKDNVNSEVTRVTLKDDPPSDLNMDTDNQDLKNMTAKEGIQERKSNKNESLGQNVEIKSTVDNSANPIQCVKIVDVKGSLSEKELEVTDESTKAKDSDAIEKLGDTKDTVENTSNKLKDEEEDPTGSSDGKIKDKPIAEGEDAVKKNISEDVKPSDKVIIPEASTYSLLGEDNAPEKTVLASNDQTMEISKV